MSNPTPDDVTTSGSNIVNPPYAGHQGPVTRQQSTVGAMAQAIAATAAAAAQAVAATPAPAASQGTQSVTATIDYHSLATAMSRLNGDSASNLQKGTQPEWDFKTETFVNWQHEVEIWADSHDIRHLLEHPPVAALGQLRKHEIAKRTILLTLPNLNVDRELSYLRPVLVRAPIAEIVAGLTDGYSYHYQDRQHQNHSGNAGSGRFQRRHPRGQGALAAAAGHPAMAGVNAVSGGEERACYNCNKVGHLREDCPELHQEVRPYLKKQAAPARGRGRGRARGRGRGGPGVAAISIAEVQSMVDSLSGAESVFLPDK